MFTAKNPGFNSTKLFSSSDSCWTESLLLLMLWLCCYCSCCHCFCYCCWGCCRFCCFCCSCCCCCCCCCHFCCDCWCSFCCRSVATDVSSLYLKVKKDKKISTLTQNSQVSFFSPIFFSRPKRRKAERKVKKRMKKDFWTNSDEDAFRLFDFSFFV